MILHPNARISSKQLTRTNGGWSGELSDLGRDFSFGRVYDDAMDVGFVFTDEVTDQEIVYAMSEEKRDREGELLYYGFVPAAHPGRTSMSVITLYND